MATPIHTGIYELNELLGGSSRDCPGYPLGHLVQFLVDEEDHDEIFEMLRQAFVAFPARWSTHRAERYIANGQEMLEGLWLSVTAPAAPAPVNAIYDMGGGMSPEIRHQLWSSLTPKLRTVLRRHERTCVVGFSRKGADTMPERAYSSVRIEVTRGRDTFLFTVLKSTISDAAGSSLEIRRERPRGRVRDDGYEEEEVE